MIVRSLSGSPTRELPLTAELGKPALAAVETKHLLWDRIVNVVRFISYTIEIDLVTSYHANQGPSSI